MSAGKFHSIFLSELGNLYTLGSNMHGQIGLSNHIYDFARVPFLVNTEGLKIKQISAGHHHSLIVDSEGKLFGFGSNKLGQINGDRTSTAGEGQLVEIKLPSNSPVVRVKASNVRS